MTFPAAVDCLAGTNAVSRCSLDTAFPYFETKMNEYERQNTTAPDGTIVLLGCSFTNYVASNYLSAYAVNLGCYGMGLRHLGQELNRSGIRALLGHAGAVVCYGLFANSIGQEMLTRTESQMYGNVDYILEGLAGWFTGKGVFVAGTPVIDPYGPDPNLTNARINQCNAYLADHFGSKSGWAVANVNSVLAGNSGNLQSQYSDGGCHLTKAGIDVVFQHSTLGVVAKLESVGVTA